jgi:hypothetical protein
LAIDDDNTLVALGYGLLDAAHGPVAWRAAPAGR